MARMKQITVFQSKRNMLYHFNQTMTVENADGDIKKLKILHVSLNNDLL